MSGSKTATMKKDTVRTPKKQIEHRTFAEAAEFVSQVELNATAAGWSSSSIMAPKREDEGSATTSPATGPGSPSYQKSGMSNQGSMPQSQSGKNSVGSNNNDTNPAVERPTIQGFLASAFRHFSFETHEYETPPGQDEDEDDDIEDSVDHVGREEGEQEMEDQTRRNKTTLRKGFSFRIFSGFLLLVILVVYFFCRYILTRNASMDNPILYTGENSICESARNPHDAATLQDLEAFSTVRNVEHGAVAADHPTCSKVGLSILQDHHGNAVDAAVATVLCLGVANPSSSGIGGGAFILIHMDKEKGSENEDLDKLPKFHDARNSDGIQSFGKKSNKVTEVIDCREVAGNAASTDMFQAEGLPSNASLVGGLAIAVPGELRGLELAHARHGRLDWEMVVRPAMELARDGIAVYPHLAADIKFIRTKQERLGGLPTLRPLLTRDNNWDHPLQEGDIMKNPELAKTLEAIMEEGADAIYTGVRAEALAKDIRQAGGILTKNDLSNYYPTLRSPVVSDNIFGTIVVGVPPPSSGGAVIIGALRFLTEYTEQLAAFADLSMYRMVEAMKHAFAIRMSMGDPAFPLGNNVTNATTQDAVDALVRGPYMGELRLASSDNSILNMSQYGGPRFAQLNDSDGQIEGQDKKEGDRMRLLRKSQRSRRLVDPFGYLEDRGTSHISVVDADMNSVAITTSVNTQFGCGVVSESTGILLNNEMNDFSANVLVGTNMFGLRPSEANFIKPGKKPLSSMSPTMIFRAAESGNEKLGKLLMVVGGSGGPKIISAVLQVILHHLYLGKDLFDSMAHPRIHNQLIYHGSADTETENSIVRPADLNLRVSNRTKIALENRGNRVLDIDYSGCVQAISVDAESGRLNAVSDIRKGGQPAGY